MAAGVSQVRVTFTSSEVGNGNPNDSGTMTNQDGGLAVRLQDEDEDGNLVGPVTRSSDEGVTFGPVPGVTYDVRDLVSGVQRGDQFTRVILGTQGNDVFPPLSPAAAEGPIYINAGQGNDIAFGTNFDDFLVGGAGNDQLFGGAGDDSFIGGGGDDLVDGGEGFDTAIFTTSFAATRLVQGGDTAIFSGSNGTDTLTDIDRFEFTDIAIEFRPEVYGDLQTGTGSAGVQVAALFDGILGREVDRSGLVTFTNLLDGGGTVTQAAEALLNSDEYTARFGDVDAETNEGFVTELYQIALGRTPDQGGFDAYVTALNNGVSRADVARTIALSEENFAGLTVDETGILVPDADAAAAARLYFGLLDRAPDAGGVANFASFLDGGATATQAAQAFLDSAEYQANFAGQSDDEFVDGLYENALGRDPDAGGFEAYTTALENGASRAEVAAAITQSVEAQVRFDPIVEQGWIVV